ncbi:MAG: hypothetical protein RIB71_24745 [Imperialibacter sp.]|uniref:hypothetical protein n=1 Tax=Imperialibacter sp. TaxID=2038411 RepID=UPI0032EA9DE7
MPIDRHSDTSPRFFEPEEHVELAKYIDITKFLSLLKDQQLFFCRLDKLEDRFEGTMPKISRNDFIDFYKHVRDVENFFDSPLTDEQVEKKVDNDLKLREKFKSLNCINCWNEFKGESYALWKIYSDLNQGIMIKSSFKRIIRGFEGSRENIYCSRVKYIDYEKDSIDIGNIMTPVVHKHKAYSYENEIRLIHQVSEVGWIHDWENEKFESGVKVSVNLQELFNEIIISPFSPDWFVELIKDILNRYSVRCNVVNSKLK